MVEVKIIPESHLNLIDQTVFIVWTPEYNLGIPIINEHHRGIVSIINSLHYGMQSNYIRGVLIPIIDMMYDYTRIHFQVEENFLNKINFPTAKMHHDLHLELLSRLTKMRKNSLLEKDPYEFMDFLKKWWANHICIEDLKYREYLLSLEK